MSNRVAAPKGDVATTCPYCGVGCGILVQTDDYGRVSVKGNPDHPANFGRLCSKGAALADTLDLDGRLLHPRIEGCRASWDEALSAVANGFMRIIRKHGPDAVAFYVSGQLLTEDYYVANKLMKGFIGSANIDTNSRLCMSSAVAGYKRAFGSDTVPTSYQDLELANLIVLVGSNAAWCHPVVYQRINKAKLQRPDDLKIVVIDPRRTSTCEIANLHLQIKPGTDALLFNGLLNFLRREDGLDLEFLENHTEGFAAAMAAARASAPSIPAVADACDLPEEQVAEFYQLFARTERTVMVYSQGVNQSSCGTDKVNSIINCHLATGRIGRPGMGPFSITGQPNAMGGREVGGLANQLAAHMDFENPQDRVRVGRFWQASNLADKPGLKAVDLFNAIEAGTVKAVWVMATNPAVSMPDADRARAALEQCEWVVVSDCVEHTDTTACAHVLLPAATWGEKEGTVTNSERCISRQRAFLAEPGEARPDWWIITQVAHRMGFAQQFPYSQPAEIFREHASLSGFENDGSRDFDIGGLARMNDFQYETMEPIQWPVTATAPNGTKRMFADGRFYTASGKAQFVSVTPRPPAYALNDEFPLVLNTGRIRDQWHTMTRTAKSPRLTSHIAEPFVEIHPIDARTWGLEDNSLARVSSRWGSLTARVTVSEAQRRGSVFVPMHWSSQFSSHARVGALINPVTDPLSGQPESKHTPVRVAPFQPKWQAFILSRKPLDRLDSDYWTQIRGRQVWRYELAGIDTPYDWLQWARDQMGKDGEWLDLMDRGKGVYRGARIEEGRLAACLFVAPTHELPSRDWLASCFTGSPLSDQHRLSLLSGRLTTGQQDSGRTICSCFGVGVNTIVDAIRKQNLTTPEAIGRALKAGTNCGSCIPELGALIAETSHQHVA